MWRSTQSSPRWTMQSNGPTKGGHCPADIVIKSFQRHQRALRQNGLRSLQVPPQAGHGSLRRYPTPTRSQVEGLSSSTSNTYYRPSRPSTAGPAGMSIASARPRRSWPVRVGSAWSIARRAWSSSVSTRRSLGPAPAIRSPGRVQLDRLRIEGYLQYGPISPTSTASRSPCRSIKGRWARSRADRFGRPDHRRRQPLRVPRRVINQSWASLGVDGGMIANSRVTGSNSRGAAAARRPPVVSAPGTRCPRIIQHRWSR